ncbi:MAG: hypothetical protein JF610_16785 [Acidobacteria bacterium]|jgi:hypothetical protein|nr:hypothetical protein [Acidobacteriota bacterium]
MRGFSLSLAVALLLPVAAGAADKGKPNISVKANPVIAFSPARVVVTADLKGGANDYEEFYCPSIEWEWGDGTISEQTIDCDPYEAGKSEIKRHFTASKIFQTSGDYRVQFRIKKKDKTIAVAGTDVKIRPGAREAGGGGGS